MASQKPAGACSVRRMEHTTPWMTKAEAAEYTRVVVDTIDRWVREEKITRYKIGDSQSVRFRRDELDALMTPESAVSQ